jgi:hypothetical protein
VLTAFVGRTRVEMAKTGLLLFVALIAVIALQQLASTRSTQTATDDDRATVLGVASDFGQGLTTYDYAHPDVQANQLTQIATPQVLAQVRGAFPDLALYRAVSIGQVPEVYLQTLDVDHAQVLVQTKSTMQSQYLPSGTVTTGLLVCDLTREGSEWRVGGYTWLTPVTEGVSYATPNIGPK